MGLPSHLSPRNEIFRNNGGRGSPSHLFRNYRLINFFVMLISCGRFSGVVPSNSFVVFPIASVFSSNIWTMS